MNNAYEPMSLIAQRLIPFLLDAALKGSALLLITALIATAMRRASAAARHLMWLLAIVSVLALPILSVLLPGWNVLPAWSMSKEPPNLQVVLGQPRMLSKEAEAPASDTHLLPPYSLPIHPATPGDPSLPKRLNPAFSTTVVPAGARFPITAIGLLFMVWLLGAAGYLFVLFTGVVSLWRLRLRSSPIADAVWLVDLNEACVAIGIRRRVALISSESRLMPMTWGLWSRHILLPGDTSQWTAQQRRTVLLHELAHVRRRDCQTQLLTQLACALHWFNPLVWYVSRQMQAERERACDDMVLSAGTRASAYAEQLLSIAAEMPASRYRTVAIAMARPGTLEGRLLAILDIKRNRARITARVALLALTVMVVLAMPLAMLHADAVGTPAMNAVAQWAKTHGWSAQEVAKTTLESKLGGWRNLPFTLDAAKLADAKACVALAQQAHSVVDHKSVFSGADTRTALEAILKNRPGYFYAEFLLSHWYRDNGDAAHASHWLDAAYRDAPTIIVQRFELADGSPAASTHLANFSLECNRVINGSLDPSLELPYPDLETDAQGCIFLPVYNTVYRTNSMSWPNGYDVNFPTLGWFESSRKVALLPVATLTPKPGDFAAPLWEISAPTTHVTLPGDNAVELLAVSAYPDPQNTWWLPDGTASPERYTTGEPGISPWPAENGRRFIFRFAKALEPDAHIQFRFSVPTDSQSHYTTVRQRDLARPFVLFTAFPTHPQTMTMRLGESSGPWKKLATFDPRNKATTGDLPAGFAISLDERKENDFTELVIAHPVTDLELRVTAIDDNQQQHTDSMSWFSVSEGISKNYYRFNHLPSANIQRFKIESREYQWVEFKNIAIQLKTDTAEPTTQRASDIVDQVTPELPRSKPAIARAAAAKHHYEDIDRQYRVGLASVLERERAKQGMNVAQAEQTGDAVKMAQAHLDRAKAIFKIVQSMYQAGLSTAVELHDAESDVKICEAEAAAAGKNGKSDDPRGPRHGPRRFRAAMVDFLGNRRRSGAHTWRYDEHLDRTQPKR